MATINAGKVKRNQDITPSTAYRAFYPGAQAIGSGDIVDRSGQGNDASALGAGITDAQRWANAGWISSLNGNDSASGIDKAIELWDLSAGESLIFFFTINMVAPTANDGIIGNFKTGTVGTGFRLVSGNLGIVRGSIKDVDNNVSANADSPSAALDGTTHKVVLTVDSETKLMTVYVDGASGASVDISAITGKTVPSTLPFNFGNDGNTAVGATKAGKFNGVHIIALTGNTGLPSNILELINLYQSRVNTLFSVDEVGV